MRQFLFFLSVAIFSVFIGSQITEGALLLPYWKSLLSDDFYTYYNQFGPSIGLFYTVLTIIAALIPVAIAIYCKSNSSALRLALTSTFFALLFLFTFILKTPMNYFIKELFLIQN